MKYNATRNYYNPARSYYDPFNARWSKATSKRVVVSVGKNTLHTIERCGLYTTYIQKMLAQGYALISESPRTDYIRLTFKSRW